MIGPGLAWGVARRSTCVTVHGLHVPADGGHGQPLGAFDGLQWLMPCTAAVLHLLLQVFGEQPLLL